MHAPGSLARRTDADRAIARRLFVVFFLAYVLLTRGHFISTDEVVVYQTAQSLWDDGDLYIAGCYSAVKLPDGRWVSRYGIGQALLSVPLYGLGKAAGALCDAAGADSVKRMLSQRWASSGDTLWSGEPSIFFVMLLPCAAVAALCSGFFLLSRRLGASRPAALAVTFALGLASHVATFGTQYFQHGLEAALLLWSFLFLVDDAAEPSWRRRAAAGVAAALLVLARIHGALALPMLGLYLLASAGAFARPVDAATLRRAAGRAVAFAVPVAAGLGAALWLNRLRFGSASLAGRIAADSFDSSALDGIWGLLLSPGSSVFVYTPALVLGVIAVPSLARRRPRETAAIVAIALAYLVVHGSYRNWHGHSCIGPRYLAAVVPLVLLALPSWLDAPRIGRRIAFAAAVAAGLVATLLQVLVNYWKVIWTDRLNPFTEGLHVLFVPDRAPLLAHARALAAWDDRVEFWLRECRQEAGPWWTAALILALLAALALAVARLRAALALPEDWAEPAERGARRRAVAAACVVATVVVTEAARRADAVFGNRSGLLAAHARTMEEEMQAGVDLLWKQGRADAAIPHLRRVLELSPSHYGANYQLAVALESVGRHREAGELFELVLDRAIQTEDTATQELTRRRLLAEDHPIDDVMQQGLDALRLRGHPRAAAELFGEVLRRRPSHYGATFQLAVALDASGRRAEARPAWEKALAMARESGDAATAAIVEQRLEQKD